MNNAAINQFSSIVCQSRNQVGQLPDKPKIKVEQTLAEKLFIGDDTFLGTVKSAAMCLLTVGIGPLAVLIDRWKSDYQADIDNKIAESHKKAQLISALGIDDSPGVNALYDLSVTDLTQIKHIIEAVNSKKEEVLRGFFQMSYTHHRITTVKDNGKEADIEMLRSGLHIGSNQHYHHRVNLIDTADLLVCWKSELADYRKRRFIP